MTHILDGTIALAFYCLIGFFGFVAISVIGLSMTRKSDSWSLLPYDVSYEDFRLVGLVQRLIRRWDYRNLIPVAVRTRTKEDMHHWQR